MKKIFAALLVLISFSSFASDLSEEVRKVLPVGHHRGAFGDGVPCLVQHMNVEGNVWMYVQPLLYPKEERTGRFLLTEKKTIVQHENNSRRIYFVIDSPEGSYYPETLMSLDYLDIRRSSVGLHIKVINKFSDSRIAGDTCILPEKK